MKEEKIIDCFGDICPIPLLKIEMQLETIKSGESFKLVTDHSCTIESIRHKYKNRRIEITITEVMNGVWEVCIKKN